MIGPTFSDLVGWRLNGWLISDGNLAEFYVSWTGETTQEDGTSRRIIFSGVKDISFEQIELNCLDSDLIVEAKFSNSVFQMRIGLGTIQIKADDMISVSIRR